MGGFNHWNTLGFQRFTISVLGYLYSNQYQYLKLMKNINKFQGLCVYCIMINIPDESEMSFLN